jgi:TolA-binding protein
MPQKKRAEPGATTRAKSSASASETAKAKIAVAEPESVSARQIKSYELGIRAFREQRLVEARDFFQEASTGPLPAVAHNARLHLGICERRGKNGVLKFESPEEHYNYAVERINSGNLTEARQHLLTAQSALPDGDSMP